MDISHRFSFSSLRFFTILVILLTITLSPSSVLALSSLQENDPVAQCVEGVKLFEAQKNDEAFPFLEAGFTNRDKAIFSNSQDLGLCALALGNLYGHAGKYIQALDANLVALEMFKETGDIQSQGITRHNIGNFYMLEQKYVDALNYYQQTLDIMRSLEDQWTEALVLVDMANVYQDQGQTVQAFETYDQALTIYHALGDRKQENNVLYYIGVAYYDTQQYDKALDYFQQALLIAKEIQDRPSEGWDYNYIGLTLGAQEHYKDALENFQQSLAIMMEVKNQQREATVLSNIARSYFFQKSYTKALDFYQQALVIAKEIEYRSIESNILAGIGDTYIEQGRYGEALNTFQQALIFAQETGQKYFEVIALGGVGRTYEAQGQHSQALDQLQKALALSKEINFTGPRGAILENIGTIYLNQGEDDKALQYFQQVLDFNREIGNETGQDFGFTLGNIGSIYAKRGEYEKGLQYLHQALELRRNLTGEANILLLIGNVYRDQKNYFQALDVYQQALTIAQETSEQENASVALNNIGWVYSDQNQSDKALPYYEQAMDLAETVRSTAGSDEARANFIAQYSELYVHAAEIYSQEGQPEKAFFTSERGRARAFLDSMSTGYVELNDDKTAALYTQEQEAYAKRKIAQDALIKAKLQKPPDENLITDLEGQLTQSETDYQAVLDRIAASDDQLAQLVPGKNVILGVSQAEALLDDHTTLLSFWVAPTQTLVFVFTHNSFQVVAIPISSADLRAKVEAFRSFANTDRPYPESAVDLYQSLIAPLKPYLGNPNLIIVPNGILHYLPFAALTDGARYLIDDYTITYLPSLSAWPYIKQNANHAYGSNPLVIGNPATDNTDLKALPFAEKEAEAVASLYNISPLLGTNATESALRSQVQQAGVLHLAAHGSYNQTNPLYSAIYLTPDGTNDGALEVHEIYSLKLTQTDLVVLSACQTQLGELSTGDEFVGMTRAFFFAGAPSILSSLWEVDDQATALFMERFYINWRSGMNKAEALKQAQIDIRKEYPNPYYWAGFVLNGDSGKGQAIGTALFISTLVSMPTGYWLALFLGVGVLGISVYYFSWRRRNRPIVIQKSRAIGTSPEKLNVNDEIQKAIAFSQLRRHQESFNILRQVIQTEPENTQAWLLIGFALSKLGDVRTAERCFSRAKKLGHPQAAQALEWLRSVKQQ